MKTQAQEVPKKTPKQFTNNKLDDSDEEDKIPEDKFAKKDDIDDEIEDDIEQDPDQIEDFYED